MSTPLQEVQEAKATPGTPLPHLQQVGCYSALSNRTEHLTLRAISLQPNQHQHVATLHCMAPWHHRTLTAAHQR